jgi:hypothetical protein
MNTSTSGASRKIEKKMTYAWLIFLVSKILEETKNKKGVFE